jgi:hypothetical protein
MGKSSNVLYIGPRLIEMKIILENFNKNILVFTRDCGYRPLGWTEKGELNCAKSLAGKDYPRFHAYIKQEEKALIVNLHLDQKRPSYTGAAAHSGEYEGEVVEEEARRIKSML